MREQRGEKSYRKIEGEKEKKKKRWSRKEKVKKGEKCSVVPHTRIPNQGTIKY